MATRVGRLQSSAQELPRLWGDDILPKRGREGGNAAFWMVWPALLALGKVAWLPAQGLSGRSLVGGQGLGGAGSHNSAHTTPCLSQGDGAGLAAL